MKAWAKVGLGCAAVAALASIGVALVMPTLVREGRRVAGPIGRMQRSQAALDELAEKAAWKRPARDALTAEQLGRFFAVRKRVDAARRKTDLNLDQLPRVRSRLKALAEDLRRRSPGPPEGFDPKIHALLLSRIDDVERWSLDDLVEPFSGAPR